ncbi:hypothetical protein ABH923_000186 [Leifsonia sp. EB41]|uniref:hypothetical protein n=1 Tax=Leifsonia sp. EB41 TaxID=3156260 RepID=UPI003512E81A
MADPQTGRTHPFGRPVRIVGGWRAGFVVVFICVVMGYLYLTEYVVAAFIDPVAADLVAQALILGFWTCVVRLFRGRGEPVGPPRPWWQMTHRSPACWFLAVLAAAAFVWNVVWVTTGGGIVPGDPAAWVLLVVLHLVTSAALVSLLINSAIRLGRESVPQNAADEPVR